MEKKIDWKKPLRALDSAGVPQDCKVYTYKSGRQRVVWIDDRVYPVDEQGRAVAEVRYSEATGALKGSRLVENVPEEEFFVGMARQADGTYWLTDGGAVSDMGTMNYWKKIMGGQPHWIVDTRKSAEPPKEVVHDPKDFVVVYYGHHDETAACTGRLLTHSEAKKFCGSRDTIVRVRTTPAPADTARYIQLYRRKDTNDAWAINKFPGQNNRQEFTWQEACGGPASAHEHCVVKVRD